LTIDNYGVYLERYAYKFPSKIEGCPDRGGVCDYEIASSAGLWSATRNDEKFPSVEGWQALA